MKTKIAKILGVVVAAVTVVSLFAVALPVSAAAPTPQAWNSYTLPSTTGMVLNTTITAGGPIAQALDASSNTSGIGTIYAYVLDGATNKIIKSVDGGRTWKVSGTVGQPTAPVVNIVCPSISGVLAQYLPTGITEGSVVFYATASTLYWSTDSGAHFSAIVSVPPGTDAITAFDVQQWQGRYIAAIGVNSTLGGATMLAGVYGWDQSDVSNNLVQWGTTPFAGLGSPYNPMNVVAVRMAPTFSTDRALIAIGDNATNGAALRVDLNGGAWGANPGTPDIAGLAGITGATTSKSDIACPSDFNAVTSPIYFIALNDSSKGGIYRIVGGAISGTDLDTAGTKTWNNISLVGSFASGTGTILVGSASNKVDKSTNSGATFSGVTLRSTPTAGTSWVLLDRAYTTTAAGGKMVYILDVGTGGTPAGWGGAFNVSSDSLSSVNQWSLVNETISSVDNYVVAPNGDLYLITRNTDGAAAVAAVTAGAVTITAGTRSNVSSAAVVASTATITVAVAGTATVTVTSGAITYGAVTGGSVINNIVTFTGAGNVTISPVVANTQFTVIFNNNDAGNTVTGANAAVITTNTVHVNYTAQLTNIAAAEVDTLTTDTVITGVPTSGVTVTGTLAPGDWVQGTGTITFAAGEQGKTAIITNTAVGPLGATLLTATYNVGAGVTTPGSAPTITANATATSSVSGAWGASGTTSSITEQAGAAAIASSNLSKIWRQLNSVGTPWERVNVGLGTDAQRILIMIDPTYTTDKGVFYAIKGSNTAISISTNNANSFGTMSSTPGANLVGGPFAVNTFWPVTTSTVVVGDTTGTVVTNTTAYWWVGASTTPFGAGYTVDQITGVPSPATGGINLLASAHNATTVEVATSTNNGQTWTLIGTNLTGTGISNSFIQPAIDFATSGNLFVAVAGTTGNGVYRYNVTTPTTPAWTQVDSAAAGGTVQVATASGLEVTAGGPGSSTEGSGMVYASDSSVAGTVARVRGTSIVSELLDSTASSKPAVALSNLQAYQPTSGGLQVFALGASNTLWYYVETLNVAGSGVAITNVITIPSVFTFIVGYTSNATITWNNLLNATNYYVYVNTVRQTNFYTAFSTALVTVGPVVTVVANTATVPGSSTCAITTMVPGTTYFVSVWATNGITVGAIKTDSSFMFAGASTIQTPLANPTSVMNLVPAVGATNIPILPNFGWSQVMGATSYTLQLTTASDTAFANPIYVNATIPVTTGPTVTWNYTGPALANNTSYIWRVMANGVGNSAWVLGNFTTIPAVVPPVTFTNPPNITLTATTLPQPTIILSQQPVVTVTNAAPPVTPVLTVTQNSYTLVPPTTSTPAYIWIIVGVGALLTLAVIILIIRTRRVV